MSTVYRTDATFVCKLIGSVLSGWRINAAEYRAMDGAALVLLNELCRPRTVDDLWHDWTERHTSVPFTSPAHTRRVAAELAAAGYLLDAQSRMPWPALEAEPLASPTNEGCTLTSRLSLLPSFVLRPTSAGLAAWSPARRQYFLLPNDALRCLPGLPEDESPSDASGTAPRGRWQDALYEAGVLVQARPDEQERPRFMTSPIHIDNLLAELKIRDERPLRIADERRVAAPRHTERTAVYLCCCIDSAAHAGWMPLALGMIAGYLNAYRGGALRERFDVVPEFLCSPQAVVDAVAQHGPGIVFMSDYEWTIGENLPLSAQLRAACPDTIIVHGGPSAPKYEDACRQFMADHPSVDAVVRGEGEVTAAEILAALADRAPGDRSLACLEHVPGLTFRLKPGSAELVRTPERTRSERLDEFPSPYLTGLFDNCPTHLLGAATLETNRGCPYGCTFCDWGSATLQKIRQFDIERVRREIDWIGRHKIPILWCADANFGIFERDVTIAQMVADTFRRYGAPKEMVVNYAKNATGRVATIVGILTRAGVAAPAMISIQTTDPTVLAIIKRSNIKTKMYDELVSTFRKEKLQVSTDLIIGLPGSTVESFERDLQYYFDREVPAKAYVLTILPNSPMAEPGYMDKYQIVRDEKGFVHSTFSFSNADLKLMARVYHIYSVLVMYSLFKYALLFLQWEYGVKSMDVIHALATRKWHDLDSMPTVAWVMQCFLGFRTSCGGWRVFLEEMATFAREEFGVPMTPAFASVLTLQEAVLADQGRTMPLEVALDHDVPSYVFDRRSGANDGRPLSTYPPAAVAVSDPHGLCLIDPERHLQYGRHAMAWELESRLTIVAPPVHFMEMEQSQMGPQSTIFSHDCRPFAFEQPA